MEWTEHYGVSKLDLDFVIVSVAYAMNGNGYQYSFGYFKSRRLYPTMDEAKAAAIAGVKQRLEKALKKIAEPGNEA